jgi:spore germination protein PC
MRDEWLIYFEQLARFLQHQDKKIKSLQIMIDDLEDEINMLKDKKNTTVEKVEYKFDQLKIETLEGTLNIGINPNGDGAFEDFEVENEKINVNQQSSITKLKDRLHHHLFSYVDQQGLEELINIEKRHNQTLDENHREMLLNDVKNQLDERLNFHLKENETKILQDTEKETDLEHSILASVQTEIKKGFETYMQQIPKGDD